MCLPLFPSSPLASLFSDDLSALSPAFGATALSLNTSVVAFNRAEGGAATAGGTAGAGVGGGVYVAPGGIAFAFRTSVFANDASTSDDDVFGILV